MRIAITGGSSTGKTTLANTLLEDEKLKYLLNERVSIDAREIIDQNNFSNIDSMSSIQLMQFQQEYFKLKIHNESMRDRFIADRSFIDIVAYWVTRDAKNEPQNVKDGMVEKCIEFARKYDTHIYILFGNIKFASDGYRSENIQSHMEYDDMIIKLLKKYAIPHVTVTQSDLNERMNFVKDHILSLI